MSEGRRETVPDLLVVTDEDSFGSAVVDAVEAAGLGLSARQVTSGSGGLPRRDLDDIEGTIIDGCVTDPTDVVEHVTGTNDLPVVVLADSTGDGETIAGVVDAGASDVLPRTATAEQFELALERLLGEDSPACTRALDAMETTYRAAYEALFEKVSEGLVVHDPETGEIVDVNERFCEMNGYGRSELLGESIGTVLTEEDGFGPDAAREMIQQARMEGPQRFEWRNRRRSGETYPVEVYLTVIELGESERVLASVQDITERKRREREYEQVFNSVQDAITVHDPRTGEMVDVNDTFCELVGYDRETILEMGTTGVSVEAEGYTEAYAEEIIAEVMSEGQKGPYEWMIETKDGEHRVTEVVATKGEIGGEDRIISINRDVTERKRRQREYEQIFNGVNDGITIHDTDTGEILDANETYLDMFGYDNVETIRELGIGGLSVTTEGYTRERARALFSDVASSGQPTTVEWQIERADGEQRWLESTVAPAEIGGEKRVLAIQRDVTKRKRRQQEFEQIFNGVQDAISVHDPDTVEILDTNEAYLDLFGYEDVNQVRELGLSGLSPTDEAYTEQRLREIHQRVVESGQPETLEWQNETRSGERIWLEVKVAPAVIGGEQRTIVIHRDVTARKRREERLEVFNRILRHNLRNELDVIRSHAEELGEGRADDHRARIIEAVSQLADIGRRARQIDRAMSRDETLQETDVVDTLRKTVERMEPARDDVTVTMEVPEETRVWTDEDILTLAVESALENALEQAASGVTVAIETRQDECEIAIADDGPGIPTEALVPIQAEKETMLQHGTGLGLWQLRWSVNKVNGTLSFEVNSGTTVRITLPVRCERGRLD